MFISSSPAALPFTRVLIGSSSSCKVNSSDSRFVCVVFGVLYVHFWLLVFCHA